ncbi:hypothetical protein N7527_000113 [Penicillium freii]|nr:hypothetical protein N7527_000113 [Penicillium freii]
MIGGNVKDVDFLHMKAMDTQIESSQDMVVLYLSNKDRGVCDVTLYVQRQESTVLNEALDNLPWTFLSSATRSTGCFFKMKGWTATEAVWQTLRLAVAKWPERLDARGWNPRFVREDTAEMAANAVMASQGNSGDSVRIVTGIAAILWGSTISALDETKFWRHATTPTACPLTLDPMTVIALVKCFVLEWSVDLDYQMYHNFPVEMYLG